MTAWTALTRESTGHGADAAAEACRRVISGLLHHGNMTDVGMETIADELNQIADRLEAGSPDVRERIINMWSGEGVSRHDSATGSENAIAPPLVIRGEDDGWVGGTVELGLQYQGPPGLVHGGIAALLLDHTLGVANHWGGQSGMTVNLDLTYHAPTPLFVPLRIRGRQESADGRKIWTIGQIETPDGQVTVSARGLFVTPKRDPLDNIVDAS